MRSLGSSVFGDKHLHYEAMRFGIFGTGTDIIMVYSEQLLRSPPAA